MDEFLNPQFENKNFTEVDTVIDESISDGTGNGLGTKVVLFNDNYHTFAQVINQLMKAIKCSEETAFYHANTIHTKGQSIIFKGEIQDCLRVSSILSEINLKTQILG
jgi:ATP-dependent Clp protease adapter protein ClpS